MDSSTSSAGDSIVVDSIHGDIRLTPTERRVIDTGSFQRLRRIKQLQMGHLTYPNATHTRFAHSLGTLGIMERVVQLPGLSLEKHEREDLRLAALLHDVGHYPYSHLVEGLDAVRLTEEQVRADASQKSAEVPVPYPDHEELGRSVVNDRKDLREAIGSPERARRIADLFTKTGARDSRWSNLVHSSLDLDRLDYLLRDSNATGLPYGMVDINYILNNLQASPKGVLGVTHKALPAADHFLFARFFIHRTVYYHKTTFGFEQACRQLLRRLRDLGEQDIPADGGAVKDLAGAQEWLSFTDSFVDNAVDRAAVIEGDDEDHRVIRALAKSIAHRRPPKLLREVSVLRPGESRAHEGTQFRLDCTRRLGDMARGFDIPLGQFLLCRTKDLRLEKHSPEVSRSDASDVTPESEEELIKVFKPGAMEPQSLIEQPTSLSGIASRYIYSSVRLYVVCASQDDEDKVSDMTDEVAGWG